MKNVLLYFVMFICVLFILLPPIFRIAFKDESKDKANVIENGTLGCTNPTSKEIVRIIYTGDKIKTFSYQFDENTYTYKDLKSKMDNCRFLQVVYNDDGSVLFFLNLEAQPDDYTQLPEEIKKTYIEVQKTLESKSFKCEYSKI